MDISDLLTKIHKKQGSASTILQELEEQQLLLNKKIHLFTVLELIDNFKVFINSDLSGYHSIKTIGIVHKYEPEVGHHLEYHLYNAEKEIYFPQVLIQDFEGFKKSLNSLEGCYVGYLNPEFKKYDKIMLTLDESAEQVILNNLLSPELQSLLNYNKMQATIPDKEKQKENKKKL